MKSAKACHEAGCAMLHDMTAQLDPAKNQHEKNLQGTHVQCPPRCLWPTSFDSQSSTHKVEVREWFQKNEYKKIKSVFITLKFILFFPVISHFDEVLIVFQKNQKNQNE
jgi:hypothetical protein